MRVRDYPDSVDQAASYSAGDVGIILRVSRTTANRLIDGGTINSHREPRGGFQERVVLHENLIAHLKTLNPADRLAAAGRIKGFNVEALGEATTTTSEPQA